MKRLILLCVLSVLCITSCSKKEAVLLDDSYTVTLYPNPVRVGGTVNISVYGFPVTAEEITFRLINKNGEVFLETTNSSFNFNFNLNTHSIPPGIYLLDCETDNGLLREELVIYPSL